MKIGCHLVIIKINETKMRKKNYNGDQVEGTWITAEVNTRKKSVCHVTRKTRRYF